MPALWKPNKLQSPNVGAHAISNLLQELPPAQRRFLPRSACSLPKTCLNLCKRVLPQKSMPPRIKNCNPRLLRTNEANQNSYPRGTYLTKRVSSSSRRVRITNKLSAGSAYVSETPLKRPAHWQRDLQMQGRNGSTVRAACSQRKRTLSSSLRSRISDGDQSVGMVGGAAVSSVGYFVAGKYSKLVPCYCEKDTKLVPLLDQKI